MLKICYPSSITMKNKCLINNSLTNRSFYASSLSSSTDSAVSSSSSISQSSLTDDNRRIPEFRQIEKHELAELLRNKNESKHKLLILDCRNFSDYNHSHVIGSINILYARMQRKRLFDDKLCCATLLNQQLSKNYDEFYNSDVVLYGGDDKTKKLTKFNCTKIIHKENVNNYMDEYSSSERCIELFFNKLKTVNINLNCRRIMLFKGSFVEFRNQFPDLCETNEQQLRPIPTPSIETVSVLNDIPSLMSYQTGPSNTGHNNNSNGNSNNNINSMTYVLNQTPLQRLSLPNSFSHPCLYSAPVLTSTKSVEEEISSGPTQILDFMFLGSQKDALNSQVLKKHGISKIINLSENCPKPECITDEQTHFLRIPIKDSYSAKLLPHFDAAYEFLDSAKKNNEKVLVHCLAGISRSATLAIAYIMRSKRLPSDEAYKFVKNLRPSISPNFNFMGQLLEYEKQLRDRQLLGPTTRPHSYAASPSDNKYELELPSTSNSKNDLNLNDICVNNDQVLKNKETINENGKRTMNKPLTFPERPKQLMKTDEKTFFQKRPGSIPLTPIRAPPNAEDLPSPSTEFANLDISNPTFSSNEMPEISKNTDNSSLSVENPMFCISEQQNHQTKKNFVPSKMLQTHCSRSLIRYLKSKKQKMKNISSTTSLPTATITAPESSFSKIIPCSSRCVISDRISTTNRLNKKTTFLNPIIDLPDAELSATSSSTSKSAPVDQIQPTFRTKRSKTVSNAMDIDDVSTNDPYRDPERESIGSASEITVN